MYTSGMSGYIFVILIIGWLAWMIPFLLIRRSGKKQRMTDTRARWGILLEIVAYVAISQNRFWVRQPAPWRVALGTALLACAAALTWTSTRALGRQWRVDAGLNADHELVRSGAYRVVRHPIYTSMLCLLLGMGFLVTRLPVLAAATVIFLAGTEIRIRVEDSLLLSRFGETFRAYQRSVPAYIPFSKRAS